MKTIYTSIIAVLALTLFGCILDSKPEAPKKAKHVFTKYYIRYLQTEKELKAEVSFKEGDSLATARSIVLNDVTFQNTKMDPQNLGNKHGIRYGYRKKGPYSNQYQFSYNHKVLGQLSHTIQMAPLTEFLIKEGTINKKSGMTIVWKGDPLDNSQDMVLFFTDKDNKAFPIPLKGPTERNEVFIPAVKLAGLTSGKGNLMLVKKQYSKVKEKNMTKLSEIEFYSNNLPIEVAE